MARMWKPRQLIANVSVGLASKAMQASALAPIRNHSRRTLARQQSGTAPQVTFPASTRSSSRTSACCDFTPRYPSDGRHIYTARHRLRFADGGYDHERTITATDIVVKIVRKMADQVGFAGLPRRWVVERFFAWINPNRRLTKDFEATAASGMLAM